MARELAIYELKDGGVAGIWVRVWGLYVILMLRELVDMKLSMACGRVGSRFVQGGGFAIGNFRLGVALSRVAASGRLAPRCSVSGQSEGNAPVQRIEAEDNPFVKPLSNVYFVVPCRLCQGT